MPVIITLAPLLFPPFFTLVSKIYLRTRCLNVATDGMGKRMDEGKKKGKKRREKKKQEVEVYRGSSISWLK